MWRQGITLLWLSLLVIGQEVPEETPEPSNVCDIQRPESIYCYCDSLDLGNSTEANCWIFAETTIKDAVWDSFSSQPHLQRLTFNLREDGSLEFIPRRTLLALSDLELLDVKYANISDIASDDFSNSTSLKHIYLQRNEIVDVKQSAFSNMPKLEAIHLGENKIKTVRKHSYTNLPALKTLYMDRNQITHIQDKSFRDLKSLQELELFNNLIREVNRHTFNGLTSLQRLDLRENKLEFLDNDVFSELQSLKFLDISANNIRFIAEDSFKGLGNLMELHLRDNKLVNLGANIFQGTPQILVLDLRMNVLETLNVDALGDSVKDNLLNQSMNLNLAENNLACDCRLEWLYDVYSKTASPFVKSTLEGLRCYLDSSFSHLIPPPDDKKDGYEIYETTTYSLGIRVKLFEIDQDRLPCNNKETTTQNPQVSVELPPVEASRTNTCWRLTASAVLTFMTALLL